MLIHLVNAHRFFCRKSQHYVLGNWSEYVPWSRAKIAFFARFPIAYVKFMGWAVYDGWHGHRYPRY